MPSKRRSKSLSKKRYAPCKAHQVRKASSPRRCVNVRSPGRKHRSHRRSHKRSGRRSPAKSIRSPISVLLQAQRVVDNVDMRPVDEVDNVDMRPVEEVYEDEDGIMEFVEQEVANGEAPSGIMRKITAKYGAFSPKTKLALKVLSGAALLGGLGATAKYGVYDNSAAIKTKGEAVLTQGQTLFKKFADRFGAKPKEEGVKVDQ